MICDRSTSITARLLVVLPVVVLLCPPARGAQVGLRLSARESYVGRPIYAQLSIDNASDYEPPVLPDVSGLEIRSTGVPSESSQTTIINGQVTKKHSITYAFSITPLRSGRFVIPSIKVRADGEVLSTRPVEFVAVKSSTGDLLFVEVVGEDKKVYIGEPVRLKLRIWIRPYTDTVTPQTLGEADMWGLVSIEQSRWGPFRKAVEDMCRNRRRPRGREVLRKDNNGIDRSYYLYEIDSQTWPSRAGPLGSGGVVIVVDYPTGLRRTDGFFTFGPQLRLAGTRPIVQEAKAADISVLSVPTAGRPAMYRGAVGRFEISATALPREMCLGDPITLTLTVRSLGPTRMDELQAPPLEAVEQLTRNFNVPHESLGGIVKGKTKTFTVSLRAKNEKATEIPPIPLVFFNPEAERFQTTWTKAIPLKIKPVDKLGLSKVVSATSPSRAQGELTERIEGINANFVGPGVLRDSRERLFGWWIWTILTVGPALFLVSVVAKTWRALRNDPANSRKRTARRRAMRRLGQANGPEDISAAVKGYIADHLDAVATGMTRADVVDKLRSCGVDDKLIREIDELLVRCEERLYSASQSGHGDRLAQDAKNCVSCLEKFF